MPDAAARHTHSPCPPPLPSLRYFPDMGLTYLSLRYQIDHYLQLLHLAAHAWQTRHKDGSSVRISVHEDDPWRYSPGDYPPRRIRPRVRVSASFQILSRGKYHRGDISRRLSHRFANFTYGPTSARSVTLNYHTAFNPARNTESEIIRFARDHANHTAIFD